MRTTYSAPLTTFPKAFDLSRVTRCRGAPCCCVGPQEKSASETPGDHLRDEEAGVTEQALYRYRYHPRYHPRYPPRSPHRCSPRYPHYPPGCSNPKGYPISRGNSILCRCPDSFLKVVHRCPHRSVHRCPHRFVRRCHHCSYHPRSDHHPLSHLHPYPPHYGHPHRVHRTN